jgi:hypothetical protein
MPRLSNRAPVRQLGMLREGPPHSSSSTARGTCKPHQRLGMLLLQQHQQCIKLRCGSSQPGGELGVYAAAAVAVGLVGPGRRLAERQRNDGQLLTQPAQSVSTCQCQSIERP